jgi:hypothetical protein
MITLSEKWQDRLASQPETGMGYQICSIKLTDGRELNDVTVLSGQAVVSDEISSEEQIESIEVTRLRR